MDMFQRKVFIYSNLYRPLTFDYDSKKRRNDKGNIKNRVLTEERIRLNSKQKSPDKIGRIVNVDVDLKASLTCPSCAKSKRQSVSGFFYPERQARHVRVKCTCSCQHIFSVLLKRRLSVKKEAAFTGSDKNHKWVIKKEKNYQAYAVLTLFSLMIIMLTFVFYLILDVDVSSKLSFKSDIHNGEEIKSIYDDNE